MKLLKYQMIFKYILFNIIMKELFIILGTLTLLNLKKIVEHNTFPRSVKNVDFDFDAPKTDVDVNLPSIDVDVNLPSINKVDTSNTRQLPSDTSTSNTLKSDGPTTNTNTNTSLNVTVASGANIPSTSSWKRKLAGFTAIGATTAGLVIYSNIKDKEYKKNVDKFIDEYIKYLEECEKLEECAKEQLSDIKFNFCLEKKPKEFPLEEDFIVKEKMEPFNNEFNIYNQCLIEGLKLEENTNCSNLYNNDIVSNPPLPPNKPKSPVEAVTGTVFDGLTTASEEVIDEILEPVGGQFLNDVLGPLFGDWFVYLKWGLIGIVIIIVVVILVKINIFLFSGRRRPVRPVRR